MSLLENFLQAEESAPVAIAQTNGHVVAPTAEKPVPVRLSPDMPGHFALYGEFENRVIAFLEKYGINASEKIVRHDMRTRFMQQPALSGYFLIQRGGKIVGHVCGWFIVNYGEPLVHIAQAEVDDPGAFVASLDALFPQFVGWLDQLDDLLKKENPPTRVVNLELITWHDTKKWEAALARFVDVNKVRSVIRLTRREQ
jgi:hypothetical protein